MRINALVSKAQKVPEKGWTMQDGTPWPGNDVRDHAGMIQVRSLEFFNLLFLYCWFWLKVSDICFITLNRFFLVKVEVVTPMEMNYLVWCMSPEKKGLVSITIKKLVQ